MARNKIYKLVQYLQDGILQTCHSSKVRKKKMEVYAQYLDKNWYTCKILCSYKDKRVLESFEESMRLKLPYVLLDNFLELPQNSVSPIFDNGQNIQNSEDMSASVLNTHSNTNNESLEFLQNSEPPVIIGNGQDGQNSKDMSVCVLNTHRNTNNESLEFPQNSELPVIIGNGQDGQNSKDMSVCVLNTHSNTNNESLELPQNLEQPVIIDNGQDGQNSKDMSVSVLNTHHNTNRKNITVIYDCFINDNNFLVNGSTPISFMDTTKTYKSSHKRHACFYCKKNVMQISRHLLSVHSTETEVQEIKLLGNPLRRKKLNLLRNKGDFEYNKSSIENIVVRQSTKNSSETHNEKKYIPCPSCFGYFIKDNLRHHKSKCLPQKGDRQLQANSRKLLNNVHERASDRLKNCVIAYMFQDEILSNVLFDETLILYGNYLCVKYTQDHLKNHVRAQLRLLGRLMLHVKLQNGFIKSCKDLMQSVYCDIIRKAIDQVAELDETRGIYKHPYNARTLGTAVQKIVEILKSESIKKGDDNELKVCTSFQQVYKIDIAPYLNRICRQSEKKQKRIKNSQVNLPEIEEIQKYFEYLLKHAAIHRRRLEEKFVLEDWKYLAQYLLVALAVFNRKRPGEIQRLELEDFYRRQRIDQKELNSLEFDDKLQADKYVRVGFGGKLGNATALLIDTDKILPGLLIILKYRDRAGVHKDNPFLFGAPSDKFKTFSTYSSHQLFLSKSGMKPNTLSFTNLRYHLATEVSKGGSTQEEEMRVSNYMSHDYNIHKNIYDKSAVVMDITKVSKHLEASSIQKEPSKTITINNVNQNSLRENNPLIDNINTSQVVLVDKKRDNYNYKCGKRKNWDSDADYKPNSSSSSCDEPDIAEVERCLGKLQNRNSWTSIEKNITRQYFKEELTTEKLLDSGKVKTFKMKYIDIMQKRTVPMIKQWIKMEKTKLLRESLGMQDVRPRYSTPERELLESSTEYHLLNNSEPSLEELEELIDKTQTLKKRSASSLLRKFKELKRKRLTT